MHYPIEAQRSEELELIRAAASEFAQQHILPHVMEWDEAQTFPKQLFHEMGKLGFLGVLVSPEYGGAGMGYAEYITIVDEIATVHAAHQPIRNRGAEAPLASETRHGRVDWRLGAHRNRYRKRRRRNEHYCRARRQRLAIERQQKLYHSRHQR